jgi:translation initiation factor IF-3
MIKETNINRDKDFKGTKTNRNRINFQIRVPNVRLIGDDGTQYGIVDRREALKIAQEQDLDLVEIVPTSSPPVCRVMDYKKFLYEQKKKEKELKKKQKISQLKGIRFTPEISEHDYKFKKQHVEDFLKEGYRVKVTIFYKGREILHKERGYQMLERLTKELASYGKIEFRPKLEGKYLTVTLVPV